MNIAYQTCGDGPQDLIFVPGWISHIEQYWENPYCARFLRRLASFSRLVVFDKRGTGLSDRVLGVPHFGERVDDVAAVMAAAGSQRAALMGFSEGGAIASVFAATYPQRTSALVLYGANAKCTQTDDYPCGYTPQQADVMFTDYIENDWGSGRASALANPSVADDPQVTVWAARLERLGASPGAALELWKTDTAMDVRAVLPTIQTPTLVLHRARDPFVDVRHGRYLAEHIAGAQYFEAPGADHSPWFGDADAILERIEHFLTGSHTVVPTDRVLTTVMFTDIVDSTVTLARLGDRRWRELLDEHDAIIRRQLARHRGREIDTAGDGVLACVDGPARAIACATAIRDEVRPLGIEVRAGLHTGECELSGDKLAGIAVHIGARIAALAGAGEVLVSRTVKDLAAGSQITFADRGEHQLKGVPDSWQIYAVS